MGEPHHLPRNRTEFEEAVSLSADPKPRLDNSLISFRTIKRVSPPPSWLPFLVYEYGLNELTPYVANLFTLIDEGVDWQRVRGTKGALDIALNWLTYQALQVEEFPARRKQWARFMIELDRVRDQNFPDLRQIDGVGNLSAPLRSTFWRAWHGYDVRALEFGWSKWAQTRYGTFSGTRISDIPARWSFGRTHENSHAMTQAELTQLGVWIDPTDPQLGWDNFTWIGTAATWVNVSAQGRQQTIASGLSNRPVWLELRDSGDQILGYRRARAHHRVTLGTGGQYQVGQDDYAVDPDGIDVYLEAMTDFGDSNALDVASWGWVFDAVPLDTDKPGLLWANPGEIGPLQAPVAVQTETLTTCNTIRDRFKSLLMIPAT